MDNHDFVKIESPPTESEAPNYKAIAVEWTESEWFQVWLEWARRDDQGDVKARNTFPGPEFVAA